MNKKLGFVLAVVMSFTSLAQAGPVGGSVCRGDAVAPYSTDIYHVTFYGGEVARVSVSGDHDTDLDLFVYDENGNLIGSDTSYSDQCFVAIRPYWTGPFTIRVVNRGGVSNRYTVCTS